MQDRLLKLVRAHDPALAGCGDIDAAIEYARTRVAEKLPALKSAPTWFTVRRLSRSQVFGFVERATNEAERWARAFAAGVIRVEGPLIGAEAWEPASAHDPSYLHMDDSELDQFAPADIVDIGQWVHAWSCAPLDCSPRLPVLPMSWVALDAYARPSAAPTPTDAAPSKPRRKGR